MGNWEKGLDLPIAPASNIPLVVRKKTASFDEHPLLGERISARLAPISRHMRS